MLDKAEPAERPVTKSNVIHFDPSAIIQQKQIILHDSLAFLKCCESLAFLVRDVAHITPHNFSQCVQALRIFVEASFCGRMTQEEHAKKRIEKSGSETGSNQPYPKIRTTGSRT